MPTTRARTALALLVIALLLPLLPARALAQPAVAPPAAAPAPPAPQPVPAVPPAAEPGAAGRASSDTTEPSTLVAPTDDALLIDTEESPVGPGMEFVSRRWVDPTGFLQTHVLDVDLTVDGGRVDLLTPEHVAERDQLSDIAERQGAIAGVNGDFFDIGNTGAALGGEITGGQLRKGPVPGRNEVAGIGTDGLGQLARLFLAGTVTLPAGERPLDGLNQPAIGTGAVGAYTPVWGPASRQTAVGGATDVTEVVVSGGVVTAITPAVTQTPIPEDGFVLVGREAGSTALDALAVGDPVAVSYAPRTEDGSDLDVAIGGAQILVRDGVAQPQGDPSSAPRTAIGFAEDGTRMILLAIDGRGAGGSRGSTLTETARLMVELGAEQALNLDGGGSSTMLARRPGGADAEVRNVPSDGFERAVPNGLGLFAAPGSGRIRGFRIAGGVDTHHPERVFPGLSRSFDALAHDETYAPVDGPPAVWQARPRDLGRVDRDGVLRAGDSGTGTIVARRMRATASYELQVLGELQRVGANVERVSLADADDLGRFSVLGHDADGYSALIEPRDVQLDYDESLLRITPTEDGGYTVDPLADDVGAAVTVTVDGVTGYLPVSVGLDTVTVAEFEDSAAWSPSSARGTATLSTAPGRTGNGLAIDYDFTQSTGTRTGNAAPRERLVFPGEPSAVGLWVNGAGRGEWLALTIVDADGTTSFVYGDYVTWEGWQYTEFDMPSGLTFPLRLSRIGAIETDAAESYRGRLVYDDLTVEVPPTVEVPEVPAAPDPLVVQNGTLGEDRWTFAVMNDSQFLARTPNSDDARLARRSLQQIVASDAEFLVVGGDLVDEDAPEDFALAQRILDEEVSDAMPIYYIPGNHEAQVTGRLDNFRAAFGETRFTFDHNGTRFILLNSTFGTLRGSEFAQLPEMKAALDDAETDPTIDNVVVFPHHPTVDPNPQAASQLADRYEVELIERWLTEFREDSDGKGVAYLSGHAHTTEVRRHDGVPYLVLPPAGAKIYGARDDGGFSGWTLFGIDEEDGGAPETPAGLPGSSEWLRAEILPLTEGVTLTTPPAVPAGETVAVTAEGQLTQGRSFPLRYPATVEWTASDGTRVTSDDDAACTAGTVALFDPADLELTACAAGTDELAVRANDRSASTTLEVAAP